MKQRGFSPLGALAKGMNACGTLMVLVIMAVILIDVFGRFFFKKPLPGTPEIVAMSIAVIVFLQFPSTLRAGRVIAADGLLEWVGNRSIRWEQWLLAAYHLLGGLMFAVVTRYVWPLVQNAYAQSDYYGSLSVFTFPKWPVFAIITFGCAVMSLQYVVLAVQYFGAGRRRERLFEIDPAMKVLS
jgi:TRAP-type C4-dicarboxylate transport system permease small subunit